MYFHVSDRQWNVGDVIDPGNWGHLIRAHSNVAIVPNAGIDVAPHHRNFMWEAALEVARRAYAAHKPSRLGIVFLFPQQADALTFQGMIGGQARVYEVTPLNPADPHHHGDMDLLHNVPGHLIDHIHDRCQQYWTQAPAGMTELLWGGRVEVIR